MSFFLAVKFHTAPVWWFKALCVRVDRVIVICDAVCQHPDKNLANTSGIQSRENQINVFILFIYFFFPLYCINCSLIKLLFTEFSAQSFRPKLHSDSDRHWCCTNEAPLSTNSVSSQQYMQCLHHGDAALLLQESFSLLWDVIIMTTFLIFMITSHFYEKILIITSC